MARKIRALESDRAIAFSEDIDAAKASVLQILARWHDAGQSHWLGGAAEDDNHETPSDRISAAFKALRDAADALSEASHQAIMDALQSRKAD